MTTEPNDGSIDSITDMLMGSPPAAEENNLDQVADELIMEPQDAEPVVDEDVTEDEDVGSYEADSEEIVDEDEEFTSDEPVVPQELSDDFELEVKSNGQMKKVTLAELKRGYAGQDYIQKGMEENANLRKEIEARDMSLNDDRQRLAQMIEAIETGSIMPPVRPSQELQASDPIGYLEAMEQYRSDTEAYQEFKSQAAEQIEKRNQEQMRQQQEYAKAQVEQLKAEIPELSDPEKGKKLVEDIHAVATQHYGVPPEILSSLVHGWEFKIMRDAVAYRKLQESKDKAVTKSKGARPVVKAGAKQTQSAKSAKQRQQAKANMKRSGSIDDTVNYLLS